MGMILGFVCTIIVIFGVSIALLPSTGKRGFFYGLFTVLSSLFAWSQQSWIVLMIWFFIGYVFRDAINPDIRLRRYLADENSTIVSKEVERVHKKSSLSFIEICGIIFFGFIGLWLLFSKNSSSPKNEFINTPISGLNSSHSVSRSINSNSESEASISNSNAISESENFHKLASPANILEAPAHAEDSNKKAVLVARYHNAINKLERQQDYYGDDLVIRNRLNLPPKSINDDSEIAIWINALKVSGDDPDLAIKNFYREYEKLR